MNLPNRLSLCRIVIIPFILLTLLMGGSDQMNPYVAGLYRLTALVMLIFASFTDWLDGYIARKRNIITNLGKLLDPLADKLLVMSLFIAFIELDLFPAWLIVIILCREFLVTGLRSLAAVHGTVLAADNWGKHKTAWQLITIILTMIFLTVRDFGNHYGYWNNTLFGWPLDQVSIVFLNLLLYGTVILTVLSGWFYLTANRSILTEE